VTFVPDAGNGGFLFPGKATGEELDIVKAWSYYKSDITTAALLEV
jgi:hypothetical protein